MSNTGVEYSLSLKDLFTPKINKAVSSTERLNNVVSKTQSSLSSLGGALGIGVGIASIVSFGTAIKDSLVNYEYFSASLRTLMKGDALAAKALEGQLVSLAAKTPFSLVEIQDATKQLLAYGFAGGEVTKNISMLGDVASALKIPFQDIAYLYGTLKTQGRAYQRDILQFQQRGIPVVEQLAKQMGVTKEKVSELVTAGKVGFPEVEKAFQSMTAEGGMFFDMMKQQTATVGGQISALGDNWEQLKVNIGKSQTGIISGTVSFFNSIVNGVSENIAQMNRFEEAQEKFGGRVKGRFVSIMDSMSSFLSGGLAKGSDAQFMPFEKELQDQLKGADTLYKQFKLKQKLYEDLIDESTNRELDITDAYQEKTRKASIKQTIEAVNGLISLAQKKGEVSKPTGLESNTGANGSTNKTGTSSTTVEARGAQNFNISIDKLIETLEFNTNNLKDSSSTIKAEVIKAMIGAVNDFQLMATK
jgi:tape measure domain-containing protein